MHLEVIPFRVRSSRAELDLVLSPPSPRRQFASSSRSPDLQMRWQRPQSLGAQPRGPPGPLTWGEPIRIKTVPSYPFANAGNRDTIAGERLVDLDAFVASP